MGLSSSKDRIIVAGALLTCYQTVPNGQTDKR